MSPKISVIIPAYNAHKYIYKAIESIYATKYENLEIIVSDDKSDEEYSFEDKNIKVYCYEENKGAGVSRQRGISHATGEWICFLDVDDWLEPGIFNIFKSNAIKEDIVAYHISHNNTPNTDKSIIYPPSTDRVVHGKIFRKSFLDEFHLEFDPEIRYYEDTYFGELTYLYANKHGNGIRYVEDIGYQWNYENDSTTASIDDWLLNTAYEAIDAELRVYELSYGDTVDTAMYCDKIKNIIAWLKGHQRPTKKAWFRIFDSLKRILWISDLSSAKTYGEIDVSMYYQWLDTYSHRYKLSIIIPLYNSSKYIYSTMERLYALIGDRKDIEVILADDNSTEDNYLSLKKYPNCKLLWNKKNLRMGGNRNRGIKESWGKFVSFLDHEDDLTDAVLEAIDKYSDDESINVIDGLCRNETSNANEQKDYRCVELVHNTLYRNSFLEKYHILFSNEIKTSEDSYFNRRCQLTSYFTCGENSIKQIEKVFYIWKHHSDSTFFKRYNNREYSEEFYREWVKAIVEAYDDSENIPDDLMKANYIRLLDNAEFYITSWSKYSANFRKANIKVVASVLLLMNKRFQVTEDNFINFINTNYETYKETYHIEAAFFNPDRKYYFTKLAYRVLAACNQEMKDHIATLIDY